MRYECGRVWSEQSCVVTVRAEDRYVVFALSMANHTFMLRPTVGALSDPRSTEIAMKTPRLVFST